ncbi:MAG TPA: TonB-dependent siderophore receptor [Burkholderiales bacterium]|nr:TonB-dependent siderophore receptor [Burkholderiales bacterium]
MLQSQKRFKLRPISAALLTALTVPATFAADPTPTGVLPEVQVHGQGDRGDFNAGVSSTGSKTATPIRDIPQSITVINRAVMDSQGVTTLKDALRNVPGITLSSGEGGNIGDNINIRGYNARTDLYLDGFRDRGHYSRETFFLDAVEVLKGPSSMLFGRGSTGGVINQVSKQADLNTRKEVSASVGTDSLYRVTADVNQQMSDTSAFRVAALGHTEQSTRDVIEADRWGVAPSLRFGIGTPTEIMVSALHQRSSEIPDYGLPFTPNGTQANPSKPVDVKLSNFYGFTDDFFDQEVDALGVRIEHRFSPALSLRNQTQFSRTNTHAAPAVFPAVTATTTGRDRREREQEDESLYNQTDLIFKFDTGTIKHTLVTGVEVGRDTYRRQSYTWGANNPYTGVPPDEPIQSLQNPVYGPMPSFVPRAKDATRTDNEAHTVALYVNDSVELTKQWKLVAGLRWDDYSIDAKTINNNTGATTAVARTDEMTSVRAGVIYQPNDRQSYYFSYGTSFNPSAEASTLIAANAVLEPEENRSFEIGAKWDLLGGKLALTTALFRIEKTNARTFDALTGLTVLDGNTRVDGFEIGASGQVSANWQVFAGYTYLDGEIVELTESGSAGGSRNGNTLQNTPEHSASLWAVYGFAPAWEAGGGAVYSSERFLNAANTAMIDGYTRLDATVAYKQKDYDLRLNVLNLNDEEYFEASSASRATPAKGRSFVGTVNYRF